MKIALLGNMNNNNFALMRYFRELGADAHLLLYTNDGEGSLGHFRPEDDTFDIEKWSPFIHRTSIPNAGVAALDYPLACALAGYSRARHMLGLQDDFARTVSVKRIRSDLAGYDRIVCTGIGPAVLRRAAIRPDIFCPYGSGIEFYNTLEEISRFNSSSPLSRWLARRVAALQRDGLRTCHLVCTADSGLTFAALRGIGIAPTCLAMPLLYSEAKQPATVDDAHIMHLSSSLNDSDLSIMMHSRLVWSDDEDLECVRSKNNHWVLHALKTLVASRPDFRPTLLVLEYGPHVEKTRALVQELGLERFVQWIPKSSRKYIMWLLTKVDIGVGEFIQGDGTIWGGTGWEVLAAGKPLLQGFNFAPGEFEQTFGHSPPPMLRVHRREDVLSHLVEMYEHPERRREIGRGAREWFTRHNGTALAKQWLELLASTREHRSRAAVLAGPSHA